MSKILILGDGLLGLEIQKQTGWDYISRKKDNFDFTALYTYVDYLKKYDEILNCIGYTDTYSDNKQKHWDINYKGVADLADYCSEYRKKIIHISTDYIYSNSSPNASEKDPPANCPNWYTYTKLLADGHVQLRLLNYLIIRTSFKPRPFPYSEAILQFGNFDYVDIVASLIIKLINKNAIGVYNVGTKVKSMGQLAQETNKDIQITNKKIHRSMPLDITMNIDKMKEAFE